MKCDNCKGEGYKDRTINEHASGIITVKEWCEPCKGNGHIPPIITVKQFCSVQVDGERE